MSAIHDPHDGFFLDIKGRPLLGDQEVNQDKGMDTQATLFYVEEMELFDNSAKCVSIVGLFHPHEDQFKGTDNQGNDISQYEARMEIFADAPYLMDLIMELISSHEDNTCDKQIDDMLDHVFLSPDLIKDWPSISQSAYEVFKFDERVGCDFTLHMSVEYEGFIFLVQFDEPIMEKDKCGKITSNILSRVDCDSASSLELHNVHVDPLPVKQAKMFDRGKNCP